MKATRGASEALADSAENASTCAVAAGSGCRKKLNDFYWAMTTMQATFAAWNPHR